MVRLNHTSAEKSADETGVPVPAGLLYYSQLDAILRVEARPNEIRALIMARNELAAWMSKRRTLKDAIKPEPERSEQAIEDMTLLPPTIDNARECKMCYAVDSCMLYRKVSAVARSHRKRRLMIGCRSSARDGKRRDHGALRGEGGPSHRKTCRVL